MAEPPSLFIGDLHGGGLVLSWRCGSQCRHCLYGCGPHRQDGAPADEAAWEALLDHLARIAPRAVWHIGGGEPFLHLQRLKSTVAGLARRRLRLEYVETNASWVQDQAQAERVLGELRELGLGTVLVSLSPFHAEFVPHGRTRLLIRAAENVLPGGAFVWIPEFAHDLAEVDPQAKLSWRAFLAGRPAGYALALADRYYLTTGGRAGRYLAAHGRSFPWEKVAGRAPCRERLADTSHFHVDGEGWFVPGLCAGLGLPVRRLPGALDLAGFPVLRFLARADLGGLVEEAARQGFRPLSGYASPCDLCTHVRLFLFQTRRAACPELQPAGFYDPRSLPGYGA
ncbi:MAG: Radical SAM domain protein [Candidatus Ozemobacter sibiricus]|jgi:hypothetical protein|uniref:Radical SAM domain protein n=1 Tax=Candidatus Ozemobacter sibiricus TaxID=2268124 RepID=A0A367ZP89_9BACT|nr:MAG: Radical SAM domain protein [Candidatus Ozemobacter sibiricus]